MVAPEPGAGTTTTEAVDGGTTFGKLRQTLSSSLLTAQDKGESAGHEYFIDVIVGWGLSSDSRMCRFQAQSIFARLDY